MIGGKGRFYCTGGAETVRYHTRGFNDTTIGVCVIGNFSQIYPSCRTVSDLDTLVRNIMMGLGKELPVVGHKERFSTECPGSLLDAYREFV